jgi:hypothetical protein
MRWEYLVAWSSTGTKTQDEQLHTLGADGWELVSVVFLPSGQTRLYFKRPVGPATEEPAKPE